MIITEAINIWSARCRQCEANIELTTMTRALAFANSHINFPGQTDGARPNAKHNVVVSQAMLVTAKTDD